MELTIKIENKNVYNSLALFLKSIGIAIVNKKFSYSKKKSFKQGASFVDVPQYGRLKGKIYTMADFNEPVDDFKEYM